MLVVAIAMAAACNPMPPASTTSPSPSPTSLPSGTAECPAPDIPGGLDLGFLEQPPPNTTDAPLVAQVLIGEGGGGMADLSQQPLVAAFELTGDAPATYDEWRAITLEAGSSEACAVRVVLDLGAFEDPRGDALAAEVDRDGARLTWSAGDQRGHCSHLRPGGEGYLGLECVIPTGRIGDSFLRVWMRFGWIGRPSAGDQLPEWALTALSPEPTPLASAQPGPALSLSALPATPFLATDSPLPGEWQLDGMSVAHGPTGWVAVGAYDAVLIDDQLPTADGVVWHSPDGIEWQRVPDPGGAFGGPGLQQPRRVVATDTAWWVSGHELLDNGQRANRLLWRSTDGTTWERVDVGQLALTDIAAGAESEIIAAGFAGDPSEPAVWQIDDLGNVAEPTLLDSPAGGPQTNAGTILSIAVDGPNRLLLATIPELPTGPVPPSTVRLSNLIWSSTDGGRTWGQSDLDTRVAAGLTGARRLVATHLGWFAIADKVLLRWNSAAQQWEEAVTAPEGDYTTFTDVAAVGDTLVVAVGGGDQSPFAVATADGTTWRAAGVPGRLPDWSRFSAIASDGERVVVVGRIGADAAAWLGEIE